MRAEPDFPEFLFKDLPPDPPKKKAPARTVNADTGNRNQTCEKEIAPKGGHLKPKAVKPRKKIPEPETNPSLNELDFDAEKSPLSEKKGGKAPSVVAEKATSVGDVKTPSDYLPVMMLGVVDEAGLKRLLGHSKQQEWISKKRIGGLMMLIDYIIRHGPGTSKQPGVAMCSDLSRQYVSNHKRAKNSSTIRQPLTLLVEIGILEVAQKAVVAPHRQASARYRLHPKHPRPKKIEVMLSAQQREKLHSATGRNEIRLNRKHPFRRQLLIDLAAVGLPADGKVLALSMMTKGERESSIKGLMSIIDGKKSRGISIDPCGTIHCFPMLAPKELKPHLTIHGQSVAICDLKSAHICVLSCVIQERIDWMAKRGIKAESLEQERRRLIEVLESADIYEFLAEGGDRSIFKKSLLSSINTPTSKAVHIEAYQRFRAVFPLTIGIIEDIKEKGHNGISRPLQHHTAKIVSQVLVEAQKCGIPCIPDTDAVIVPATHQATVMDLMNRVLFQVTGIDRLNRESPSRAKDPERDDQSNPI
jgi:hypothetical protein